MWRYDATEIKTLVYKIDKDIKIDLVSTRHDQRLTRRRRGGDSSSMRRRRRRWSCNLTFSSRESWVRFLQVVVVHWFYTEATWSVAEDFLGSEKRFFWLSHKISFLHLKKWHIFHSAAIYKKKQSEEVALSVNNNSCYFWRDILKHKRFD